MDANDIEWRVSPGLTAYPEALAEMEARAAAIRDGDARECIWLLEHPPLYTAGTSADPQELLSAERFPVYTAGRGGRYTYHGPGQRIVYVMLDLAKRGHDVRHFVHSLEGWMIASLADLGVAARRAEGRIGIWTGDGDAEAKVGAIGVRIRRWVSFHGFALNVAPDLAHFDGIVPCGIAEYPVTSLARLGKTTDMDAVDTAIRGQFSDFLKTLESSPKGG
ncbi:lipoyl(octanoyl) transferase LipB [Parasphingopyxis algicola]|uniref:lipoyl(octanoyl) transferase LipB n=1 Tax=Parasphingopyxis algicola TaxID=2026624 RepID=UPI0015A0DB44|nr:lipoyl(octanoyl) transferase LipB [Parasphingopyxis algicola]QLC24530.1 lipoyl(octanoyl) transferase LipB [Parasphingopyxis algicola]